MSTDEDLRVQQRRWMSEEIGRANVRNKAITKSPISAYIGARVGPAGWMVALLGLLAVSLERDGLSRLLWLIVLAVLLWQVVSAWLVHHHWPRRIKPMREVVDRFRRGQVEAHLEAERMVKERRDRG